MLLAWHANTISLACVVHMCGVYVSSSELCHQLMHQACVAIVGWMESKAEDPLIARKIASKVNSTKSQ